MAGFVLDLAKEAPTGKYKSTSKAFGKPYAAFITKFAEKLNDLTKVSKPVEDYLKGNHGSQIKVANPAWEKFTTGELRTRMERENKTLGGGAERHEEEHEEPIEQDTSAHKKFSSHQPEQPAGKDEVAEENIVDEEGEPAAAVKVNILPKETEEQVKTKRAAENGEESKKPAGQNTVCIEYEEAEERPAQEAPTRSADAKTETEAPTIATPVEPIKKPETKPEEKQPVRVSGPVPVEEPLVSEFANNNYWRAKDSISLEDLERENPF